MGLLMFFSERFKRAKTKLVGSVMREMLCILVVWYMSGCVTVDIDEDEV
jgi:hypothetical protein